MAEMYKEREEREQAALQGKNEANHATISLKNKLDVASDNIDNATTEVSKTADAITEIGTQLANPGMTPQEVVYLKGRLLYNK